MSQIPHKRYITIEECNCMIEKAIDRHNKTASVISASLGGILLFFYAHGVMMIVDRMS